MRTKLETAPPADQLGGILYGEPEEEQLEAAIRRFERVEANIVPSDLQASVVRFSEAEFVSKMERVLQAPTSRPYRAARLESCAGESSGTASVSDS